MASSNACVFTEKKNKNFWPHLRILSNLLGQVTGPIGAGENFVVKYGKIEGEAESDGVCRCHFGLGYVEGLLVRFLGVPHHPFNFLLLGEPPDTPHQHHTLYS